ncbi:MULTISPECIES: ATP-binding protein [unclassified Nodularia (in: cyanobacteria)]|uniref:ATP-binding protein n=1 Tax=unclassified Nodularia (in: cyanobacteria) TaxID=2656917 RepID=UPI00188050E6|nr:MULTISPECIES: ATP-binding protein [unclassified Nodularia (in: cyanobacteria)]MBE9200271.1 ATP-binding protein [Nodularia sp. LEGE 06071]MCC2693415.1 ATP-binding protein [Nodularia sp. LEGE 04288]
MSKDLLKSFQEAYRNLELLPLSQEKDLRDFRVDYGGDTIDELEQLVEDSPSSDGKIIFTGHRGCGKSTLLAEFSRNIHDRYFVVFFSIAETIEMSDVNHINILFAIGLNLMLEAEARQVNIPQSTKDALEKWFTTRTRTEENSIQAEASNENSILKLISTKLKVDSTIRYEIKQEFERKISELVAQLNIIAASIQAAYKKDVLVIIDDLDKLDLSVVNHIYKDNIKALCLPGFRIIYTIPIAALRETALKPIIENETNDQVVVMPVLKLFAKGDSRQPDAQPRQETFDILCEILQKRIPSDLIEAEIAKNIAINSGGVLRELIRIANECCRICLRLIRRQPDETVVINVDILDQAINKIRNDFSLPLGSAEYKILQNTYQNFKPEDPKEQEFLDLLHGLYVLEYRNSKNWYDVHPIVVELLRDEGLI